MIEFRSLLAYGLLYHEKRRCGEEGTTCRVKSLLDRLGSNVWFADNMVIRVREVWGTMSRSSHLRGSPEVHEGVLTIDGHLWGKVSFR